MRYVGDVFGWLLVALFTATNIVMSPFWLILVVSACLIDPPMWKEAPRLWLGLSTGQYALPWWDWANR